MADYYNHNARGGQQYMHDPTSYYPPQQQAPIPYAHPMSAHGAHGIHPNVAASHHQVPRMTQQPNASFLPSIYQNQQQYPAVAHYQPVVHDEYNNRKRNGGRYPSMRPSPAVVASPQQGFLPMIPPQAMHPAAHAPAPMMPIQQQQPFYSPQHNPRYPVQPMYDAQSHRPNPVQMKTRPPAAIPYSPATQLSPVYPTHAMSPGMMEPPYDPSMASFSPQVPSQPQQAFFSPYDPLPSLPTNSSMQHQQRALSARRLSQSTLHRAQKRNSQTSQSIASLAAKLSTANGNPKKAQRPRTPVERRETMSTTERYHLHQSNLAHHVEYDPYTYAEYRGLKSRDQNMKLPAGLGPNETDQWKLEHEKRAKMLEYAEQVRIWETERRELEEAEQAAKKERARKDHEKHIQELEDKLRDELSLQEKDDRDQSKTQEQPPTSQHKKGASRSSDDKGLETPAPVEKSAPLKSALKKKPVEQDSASIASTMSQSSARPTTASEKKSSGPGEEKNVKKSEPAPQLPLKSALKKKAPVTKPIDENVGEPILQQAPLKSKSDDDELVDQNTAPVLSISARLDQPGIEVKVGTKSHKSKQYASDPAQTEIRDTTTENNSVDQSLNHDAPASADLEITKPKKKPPRRIKMDPVESDPVVSTEDALSAIEKEIEAYEFKSQQDQEQHIRSKKSAIDTTSNDDIYSTRREPDPEALETL